MTILRNYTTTGGMFRLVVIYSSRTNYIFGAFLSEV